jgi:hypothetical protein
MFFNRISIPTFTVAFFPDLYSNDRVMLSAAIFFKIAGPVKYILLLY